VSAQDRLVAGRFRTIRRLGSGAMASVFLAEDCELGRRVAIKRLHPESPAEIAPRFRREMRVAASLSHPHVVTLFDAIVDEDSVLLIMEYVEGPTLAERLRAGALEPAAAVEILRALADAIDYLHAQGVIHRDIKPANILLDASDRVKLTDLGIASAAQATGITTSGTVLGTPAYMAPELFEGDRATPSADVYSLGALAYEMLTGRRARQGGTPVEMALRAASEAPPDVEDLRPGSPALADALQHGLARRPEDRPPSATALVDEIAAALRKDGARAPAAAPPDDAPPAPAPQRTTEVEVAAPPGDDGAASARARPRAAAAPPAPSRDRDRPPPARDPAGGAPGRDRRRAPVALLAVAAALAAAVVAAVLLASGGSDPQRGAGRGASSGDGSSRTAERSTPTPQRSTSTRGGSTATAQRSTSTPQRSTSTSTAPAPAAGPDTPEGAVQAFYERAAAHRYEEAWALASPGLRSQLGGFAAFRSQFASVRSIEFSRAETVQRGDRAATVAIATTATHTDHVDRCSGTVASTAAPDGGWLVDRLAVSC
jgi:serine/threonine-protein kinase